MSGLSFVSHGERSFVCVFVSVEAGRELLDDRWPILPLQQIDPRKHC